MAVAANRYTTVELLADIRRKGHIPSGQAPFQDSDLLAMADSEIQTAIMRQIRTARENFYLTFTDYSNASDFTYAIPTKAIGAAIADIQVINGTIIYHVPRTELSEQFSTQNSPTGFYSAYISNNSVVVMPGVGTATVRLYYYRRPNTLIASTAASQITAISGTTLTFASLPTSITTSVPCDVIKDQPGFDALIEDSIPSAVTATTVVLSSVPSTVVIGDWIALSGQTPVPQIPVEFRPLVVQRVVVKYYEIQGYFEKMNAAQKKLMEMEKDIFELINPRITESTKRLVADAAVIGGYTRWRRWRAQ